MRRIVLVVVGLALATCVTTGAQGTAPQDAKPSPEPPVSLERIKRALQQPRRSESLDQLRLAYYVTVTADAPQVNIFKDFDWKHGQVPGSPPSHQELFQQVTPKEFSAPAADFTAIAAWLGSRIIHKKPDS